MATEEGNVFRADRRLEEVSFHEGQIRGDGFYLVKPTASLAEQAAQQGAQGDPWTTWQEATPSASQSPEASDIEPRGTEVPSDTDLEAEPGPIGMVDVNESGHPDAEPMPLDGCWSHGVIKHSVYTDRMPGEGQPLQTGLISFHDMEMNTFTLRLQIV